MPNYTDNKSKRSYQRQTQTQHYQYPKQVSKQDANISSKKHKPSKKLVDLHSEKKHKESKHLLYD